MTQIQSTTSKPSLSSLRINRDAGPSVRKRSGKKSIVLVVGGLIIVFLIILFLLPSAPDVETGIVTEIRPSQGNSLLNASGYVVAQRKASVASKGTGRLIALNVVEGDRVVQGQVIARIENEDVEALLSQARAALEQARATLVQAQTEKDDAGALHTRNKALIDEGAISKAEWDAIDARYKRAVAGVTLAEANIRAAAATVRAAEVQIENTIIRAPFDGTVLTKNADVGEVVAPFGAAANARGAVVTIADMRSLQVEADVSESQIQKIKPGQPCQITLDAAPDRSYRGEVSKIVPTADRAKATVLTKIRFLELDEKVLPEMSAKVAFLEEALTEEAAKQKPMTVLSPDAVMKRNGNDVVFVVKEGILSERKIVLGEMSGSMRIVLSGVSPGERVVLKPLDSFTDGMSVRTK